MRILHVTDLHSQLPWYTWLVRKSKDFDLVCISGDLITAGDFVREQIADVSAALSSISTPLAICSGNHDLVDSEQGEPSAKWIRALKRDGVWVDGDRFRLQGRSFYCHGWGEPIPHAQPGETWIIHAPPEGTATGHCRDLGDCGDVEFGQLCHAGRGPRFALCGHVHEPKAWHDRAGRTQVFNPAYFTKSLVAGHAIYDFRAGTATWRWPGVAPETILLGRPTAEEILLGASPERLEEVLQHAMRNMEVEGYYLTPDEIEECRRRLRKLANGETQD